MKKYFLFDLDGTLTDTGEGILKSVQYALDFYGIHGEPEEKLRRFVGPPLHASFMEYYGFSEKQAFEAVEKYRERYRDKGVLENSLYPGMERLLPALAKRAKLCVATSKPLVFASQILRMRGVDSCFTVTVGANLDGTMTDKAEVIGEVLRQLGNPDRRECIMVGDRKHDILGAKACGLESIGVEYGFAEEGELQEAGAEFVVPTTEALWELCRRLTETD